jgi:uncharacterized protein
MLTVTRPLTTKKLIESYKFEHNGRKILLDVKNSNYFEIDDDVDKVVDLLQWREHADLTSGSSPEQIGRALNDLEENGFLLETEQESIPSAQPTGVNVLNAVINISHDCNLRCRYCFASTGHYAGPREFMSEEVACKAMEWFVQQSGSSKELNMSFFGGEPLMNFPLIKSLVKYIHILEDRYSKKIYMNICTNGTILNDEIIRLIKENNIGMQISLDGPKEIQDTYRPKADGSGSYDTILANVKRLLEEVPSNRIIARATIPHGMIKINEVVAHLFAIGFKTVVFVPAIGCGNVVVQSDDLKSIKEQYSLIAETFIDNVRGGKNLYVFPFGTEVQNIGEGVKRLYGCGAGIGFISISVNGDLYPCMRFTNNVTYKLGNVFDGFDNKKRSMLFNRTVEQRRQCSCCWARYLCGGGCVAVPAEIGNSILENDNRVCEIAKHIAKLAMYVNTVLTDEGLVYDETKTVDFLRKWF